MSRSWDHDRLALLVHELRSPVAALAAIADTFAHAGPGGSDRSELVRLAVAACHGLDRIVVDVIATSVRRESLDLGVLARDAATAARLRGADVRPNVAGDLPAVFGDPVRLRQALDNLVANALVHSGSGAPVSITAAVSAEGDAVLLSVTDSGVGIPESEHERIFVAGERLSPDRPGSGLGLALVRAIAEAHGGRVWVVSAPGKGTTFTVAVPAR